MGRASECFRIFHAYEGREQLLSTRICNDPAFLAKNLQGKNTQELDAEIALLKAVKFN
jgi:hypothetical protein